MTALNFIMKLFSVQFFSVSTGKCSTEKKLARFFCTTIISRETFVSAYAGL